MSSNDTANIYSSEYRNGGTPSTPPTAADVTYDNTDSGLTADDVQDAIDELASGVGTLAETVGDETAGLVKDVDELQDDVEGINDNINVLGTKNILHQIYNEVRLSNPTTGISVGEWATSANGLSITYNADGSITVDGTPTDPTLNAIIRLDWNNTIHNAVDISDFAGKTVTISVLDEAVNGVSIRAGYFDGSDVAHQTDAIETSENYTYGDDAKYARAYLAFSGSYSYDNVTVYPMIRLASDTNTTYVPYAMSNKELTAIAKSVEPHMQVATITDNTKFDGTIVCVKSGRIVSIASDIVIKNGASFITNEEVASDMILPVPSAQMSSAVFSGALIVGNNPVVVKLTDDGKLTMTAFTNSSNAAIYGRLTMTYISKE